MGDMTTISECGDIARTVLRSALSQVLRPTSDIGLVSSKNWGIAFGRRWIGALHDGFRNAYPDEERFAVFSRARPPCGATKAWHRHEYLYDVTVAETECRSAPIHSHASVPVITRCLWQVKSEVAQNSSAVAEDLGKLVLGSGASKLLIAARPAGEQNLKAWIDFIEQAAKHVPNNFFLALIPTYSTLKSAHQSWIARTACIQFYRRIERQLMAEELQISVDLDNPIEREADTAC